jgi:hypothetical protein
VETFITLVVRPVNDAPVAARKSWSPILETPYAAICAVANWAAGRGDSAAAIHFDRIEAVLEEALGNARQVIEHLCTAEA